MSQLMEVRSLIMHYYKQYEKLINGAGKFILMLYVFTHLNGFFQGGMLDRPFINIALALLSVILSPSWIVLFIIIVFSGQALLVSLEAGLVLFAAMMAVHLLFVRMYPKMSIFVILVPVCYKLGIPLAVPLMLGLFFNLDSIIPMAIGVVTYFGIPLAKSNLSMQSSSDLFNIPVVVIGTLEDMLSYFMGNSELMATLIIFAGILVITYTLRRLSVHYAHYIAIIAGVLMYVLGMILAILIMKLDMNPVMIIVHAVLSTLVVGIMQFFKMVLDYPKSESVQFEDDDYYYYVKAVPKVNANVPKRQVKRITPVDRSQKPLN